MVEKMTEENVTPATKIVDEILSGEPKKCNSKEDKTVETEDK